MLWNTAIVTHPTPERSVEEKYLQVFVQLFLLLLSLSLSNSISYVFCYCAISYDSVRFPHLTFFLSVDSVPSYLPVYMYIGKIRIYLYTRNANANSTSQNLGSARYINM